MHACRATGGSRTPKPSGRAEFLSLLGSPVTSEICSALRRWFAQHGVQEPSAGSRLAIAYSGGLDSTVLLQVAQALWPGAVVAIHVNHGLQAAAPAFEQHCAEVCRTLGLPLVVMPACIDVRPGDSLEEQARIARYALLEAGASGQSCDVVWLAQHANDQAETVMLALSRGAGVAGLAGMAASFNVGKVRFGRPLLATPQSVLRSAAATHQWTFVDDPTNADVRFARNRFRQDVMPALIAAAPGAVAALSRSARHCGQASGLLVDLAGIDMAQIGQPPALAGLRKLTPARQANVLRVWLHGLTGRAPSTAQLDELVKQVAAARTRGQRIDIKVGSGRVVREKSCLQYVPSETARLSRAVKSGSE